MIARDFFQAWLDDCVDLHARTVDHYASLVRLYINPAFGDMQLETITPSDVRALLSRISGEGHERTSEAVFVAIKAATANRGLHLLDGVRHPSHKQQSPAVLSTSEMRIYAEAIRGHKHEIGLSLALYMGMRRGEICGLRWSDVKLSTGAVHICNQRQRLDNGQVVDCKVKSLASDRTLPAPAHLLDLLRAAHERSKSDYICALTPSSLDKVHRGIIRTLPIPYTTLHGLRHSFATACVRNGGDIASLQAALGHSSVAVTINRYTHPDLLMIGAALDAAGNGLYNAVGGKMTPDS